MTLFEYRDEHLQRVGSRIGKAIVDFAREHPSFHADDLRRYVDRVVGPTAPGSCDRILRDLRKRGVVQYRVVDRRQSLYYVEAVA